MGATKIFILARNKDLRARVRAIDPTAKPEQGQEIADMIPGAQYVVMNRCGHWPQYEDADHFNDLHIGFLQGRTVGTN